MDVKIVRQKRERLEKQKKREQERRTRARSGSSARKGVDINSCMYHELLIYYYFCLIFNY